ncbi:MAG: hypothetical protein ACKVU1_18370 [bacterium]
MPRVASTFFLAILSLALAAGAGEVAVRVLGVAPAVDDKGMIVPPKEFEWDTTSNAGGWHDVEHERAKPADVYRVLILGDSYVEARHVPLDSTFCRHLERRLNDARTEAEARGEAAGAMGAPDARADSTPRPSRAEVIAIGHRGWSQREELAALEREGLALEPDLVALCFLGFNDVTGNSPVLRARAKEQEETLLMKRPGQTRVPLSSLAGLVVPASHLNRFVSYRLTLLTARLEGAADRDAPLEATIPVDYLVYCDTNDPEWPRAWAETESLTARIRDLSEAAGARFLLVSLTMPQGYYPEGLADLVRAYPALARAGADLARPDSAIAQIAARRGFDLVALAPAFRERYARDGERLHFAVNGHWNEAGHKLAAEVIALEMAKRNLP